MQICKAGWVDCQVTSRISSGSLDTVDAVVKGVRPRNIVDAVVHYGLDPKTMLTLLCKGAASMTSVDACCCWSGA